MKAAKERSRDRLIHIKTAIEKIEHYTEKMQADVFYNDPITNEAVLFQLSIIGEAVVHIDSEILEKHEFTWHKVRALRNVITHEYFGIKMDKIWSIIQHDLSGLKEMVNNILETEF